MNKFDLAVFIGLAIALFSGFSTGLVRSAITIVAYAVAMPLAVWVMSYVPPLDEQYASPLGHNVGFFIGAFLLIGVVIGKLGRVMVDQAIGDDPGIADRLGGAVLGALRVGLIATSVVLVFDRIVPVGQEPSFFEGSQLKPLLSQVGKRGLQSLPHEAAAAIDRLR